jgi:hypothetical protein
MNNNKGFIKIILLIIVVLIILGFFGFNVVNILNTPTVQANLNWFWGIIVAIWNFVSYPFIYIWNKFVV